MGRDRHRMPGFQPRHIGPTHISFTPFRLGATEHMDRGHQQEDEEAMLIGDFSVKVPGSRKSLQLWSKARESSMHTWVGGETSWIITLPS